MENEKNKKKKLDGGSSLTVDTGKSSTSTEEPYRKTGQEGQFSQSTLQSPMMGVVKPEHKPKKK